MMKGMFCLASFCAVWLAVPAQSEAPQQPDPSASLYIQKKNVGTLRWSGVGELRSKNDLCVVSKTGRYRLRLQMPGGQGRALIPDFEVIFSTMAGDRLVRQSREGNMLVFEGRTTSATSCEGGVNATLEFRFSKDDLSSLVAGNYLEQFLLSVEPA
jgi:hypothetical protein